MASVSPLHAKAAACAVVRSFSRTGTSASDVAAMESTALSYNCSFGHKPIYDKRNYHDVTGVELHQVNPQQKPTSHTDTPYYPFIYSAHSEE